MFRFVQSLCLVTLNKEGFYCFVTFNLMSMNTTTFADNFLHSFAHSHFEDNFVVSNIKFVY